MKMNIWLLVLVFIMNLVTTGINISAGFTAAAAIWGFSSGIWFAQLMMRWADRE